MIETILEGRERPTFAMPLPRDLDDWVIVRASGSQERFIGRVQAELAEGAARAMTLSPAYEYLYQLQIAGGNIKPPMRMLVPLEMRSGHTTVAVQASSVTYLREATDAERREWLALIEAAENLRKQISMAQLGFVAASGDALKALANGKIAR